MIKCVVFGDINVLQCFSPVALQTGGNLLGSLVFPCESFAYCGLNYTCGPKSHLSIRHRVSKIYKDATCNLSLLLK